MVKQLTRERQEALRAQVGSILILAGLLSGCGATTPGASPAHAASLAPAGVRRERNPVRLVAVGDLMLGTSVKRLILEKGPAYPFRNYRELLGDADIAFGNLETPLSDRGTPTAGKSKESLEKRTNYIFRAPPSAAEGLAEAGFDVVSVANNHTMDYGGLALRDTLSALAKAKVLAVGAGENLEEAFRPVFLQRNGQRFAIFAISDILPLYSAAGKRTPGIAPARGRDFEKTLPDAIAAARKEADWVLVSVHWGKEKYTGATDKQQRLGRKLIDWGADAVVGHHTHVLGPVEKYRGGVIHYSLGNFVSHPGSRRSVSVWELTFTPGGRPAERSFAFRWDGKALASR
jgi:poly-gamma-glutamate capsule biosynthesis protein CapA/YwtB (metallophosphatase superfamily)